MKQKIDALPRKKLNDNESGHAVIEFAMLLPVLFTILYAR